MSVFRKTIPVWAATLVLILVTAACIAAFMFIKGIVYNDSITLSSDGAVSASGTQPFVYGSWPALDDADFYTKTLNDLIAQKTTFVEANLSTMTLRLYENGVVVKEVQILSKGRPGSWWETPAGLYKVLAKTPSDYSHMAGVYSPWALDFQGNFLIHGWPYYPDGTPVGSTYSGGCIRLSTVDAKALYPMVPVGTPVLVSSANFTLDDFHEVVAQAPISATSYFAGDLKSDFVFAEKNPDEQVPIASITKLMTALVAVEYVNIEDTITITPDMIVKTSVPRLKVGQSYSLYDLLQPLLKESSNESAVAISNFLGPKYFVQLMNDQAASIGMTNTHFVDSSGMDWGDVSTAHDLFILAQYLYNNRSFILMMTTNSSTPNAYGPSVFTNLQNFNVFVDDPAFVGGKVGLNGGASGTIMSVFNESFNEPADASVTVAADVATAPATTTAITTATTTRPIMFVILGSSDYEKDAQNFLSWIKGNYQ
jgi:D-alanyl-D-alanine carboxypeptidase